jgi:Ni/Co efflux regulator RcnB
MQRMRYAAALALLALGLLSGGACAQEHHDDQRDNHRYVEHREWKKGYRMRAEDWQRGDRIDYRRFHLRRPPSGYEWREVDGNYVLAAVGTGVIASVIAASAVH